MIFRCAAPLAMASIFTALSIPSEIPTQGADGFPSIPSRESLVQVDLAAGRGVIAAVLKRGVIRF